MKPSRLAECLTTIRWPASTLAASLQVEDALVVGWLEGTIDIPTSVASWIEALTFTHEASDLMRPALSALGGQESPHPPEHIPVYSYHLLRALGQGPILLKKLFGTEDEGAVLFLVSRGLAQREGNQLVITELGQRLGLIL